MFEELLTLVETQAKTDPVMLHLVIILIVFAAFLMIAFTFYVILSYRAHKAEVDRMHSINNDLQHKAQELYLENLQLKKRLNDN